MGDHAASKLDHENHLLLDQPLLRLPVELLRKNFRSAHFEVEKDGAYIKNALRETATGCVNGRTSQADVLRNLDTMIARMRGIKRKLTTFAEEEQRLHLHEEARLRHVSELYAMHSVDDVKYEAWSRIRLNRLLVDYLLRHGYIDSARALAKEKGIEALVDIDTFEQMNKIRKCILGRSVTEALAWCSAGDTKKELRKMDSNLEFMLRFQQYIELVRDPSTKAGDIVTHARKYLGSYRGSYRQEMLQACGMLALPPGSAQDVDAYVDLYSPARWEMLANLFTTTHNALLALPPVPLLHVALSSGLSALKTPACHSHHPPPSSPESSSSSPSPSPAAEAGSGHPVAHRTPTTSAAATASLTASVCPICSTELNSLALNVPYAFHSKSYVEPDLLLLPNSRAYGKARLEEHARKAGLPEGQVKDLRTGEVFAVDELKKVYIT
ncbi:protein FYV10 [Durotheca rogersii]|uniref:protein FYV10 n=1 Tax=Durotheca rogersii TaxID=419775 RepID=UPI00221F5048|nr:protein FYV10 [Durotheca rogersii]KAI5864642.1 protein FYV10 [Durotheca rogersii]